MSKALLKLQPDFYQQKNTLKIARQLLGKFLCTRFNGELTCGIITETEAYEGAGDKASHAYQNKNTNRTRIMFSAGGMAYVYLCYGLHNMFNIVTHTEGNPHAILIRAIEPAEGIAAMEKRRKMKASQKNFSAGPGTVCKALGITTTHNSTSLYAGELIWIEDRGLKVPAKEVLTGPRIGIGYAAEDALRPNRFVWNRKKIRPFS